MARSSAWRLLALLLLVVGTAAQSSVKSRYTPSPAKAASDHTPSQDPRDKKFGSDAAVKKVLSEQLSMNASSVQPAVARSAANADVPMELVTDLLQEQVKEGAADKAATKAAGKLRVCIATADFWGLKAAGGTATAYHLMAAALAKHSSLQVSMLQVTKRKRVCEEAAKVNRRPGLDFHCLQPSHFEPEVAETYPYEAISMAVLSWIKEEPSRCQVLHGHEWGGAFVDVIISSHFRQLQPGFRVIVEPHGGHVWSQLGELLRPMEVTTLRIDNAERMASQLADQEISPTQYMVSFLRQRGWQLPNTTLTIPNVIPEMEAKGELGRPKPVHRIAFFSRLDERKGIKLFVEAVSLLPHHKRPNFEVYIVGPESQIDMMPSSKWLAEHTSRWAGFKTHLLINIKRDEALDIISAEGMLLVLCSMVDNMPYVVAEAAVKGIPFLAFDAGGVLELFDHHEYPDNIVWDPTAEGLSQRIAEVMSAGELSTVKLTANMSTGKAQWVQWHHDHAASLPRLVQEDKALLAETQSSKMPRTLVLDLQAQQSSLDLWEEMCTPGKGPEDEPVLLLPPEYEVIDQGPALQKIAELLHISALQGSRVKALTFGIKGPRKVSMPTSPTWMAYAGDGINCIDAVPIAIQRGTFCKAFLGQARVFRVYSSWILAMLLGHQNLQLMAFPEVLFSAADYTLTGQANCAHDKVPLARAEAYRRAASHLFRDSDDMLRAVHLAAGAQPLVSLLDDLSPMQGHKGWRYGYFDAENSPGVIQPLEFVPGDSGELLDGKWACSNSGGDYPSFSGHLLHPCTHDCCGGAGRAPFVMQLIANFYAPEGVFILAYDAFPVCGDGVDFAVDFHPAKGRSRNLLKEGYDPVPKGARPSRKRIEVAMLISPGDIFEFVVDPRENQDCDGIYIVEAKIWQSLAGTAS